MNAATPTRPGDGASARTATLALAERYYGGAVEQAGAADDGARGGAVAAGMAEDALVMPVSLAGHGLAVQEHLSMGRLGGVAPYILAISRRADGAGAVRPLA